MSDCKIKAIDANKEWLDERNVFEQTGRQSPLSYMLNDNPIRDEKEDPNLPYLDRAQGFLNKINDSAIDKFKLPEDTELYYIEDRSKVRDITYKSDGSVYRGPTVTKHYVVPNVEVLDEIDVLKPKEVLEDEEIEKTELENESENKENIEEDEIKKQKYDPQIESNKATDIELAFEKFYSKVKDNNSTFNPVRTEDTIDVTERKIEILKQTFNAEVIIDASIEDSGQLLPKNHPLTIKYGKPVIVINPNKLFSDTVIHEFAHLYIDLLGKEDGVVQEAYELLRGTELFDAVSAKYPELEGVDLDEEVLATAIGMNGDAIFKDSLKDLSNWERIKAYIINAISKMFNMQPNAVERLAKEMLNNKVRLSGTESYNNEIIRKSKYKIDENAVDKQKASLEVLDRIRKDFEKQEESEGVDRGYKDSEGNVHINSVSSYIKRYQKKRIGSDKADFEMKFEREMFNEDTISMHLNAPKVPLALVRALNDLMNNNIIDTSFVKKSDDKNWFDAYNRALGLNEQKSYDPLKDLGDSLKAKAGTFTMLDAIKENLEHLLDRAEEYQKGLDQAPLAGTIVHDAVENYVIDLIENIKSGKGVPSFPDNILDDKKELLRAVTKIIRDGMENGSEFRTEQILFSESRQLPGTADLVEVTKSGKVKIYDYKTTKSYEKFNYGTREKSQKSSKQLYFDRGYAHQLLTYGAIMSQYGLTLDDDAYAILMIEIKYGNVQDDNSDITIGEVRYKSLSDKDVLSNLNSNRNAIYKEFANSKQLDDIKIKPSISDLNDLSDKINSTIRAYKKLTKNLGSNLDDSFLNRIKYDLDAQLDEEAIAKDINKYIAKSNAVVIKSYIENVHESLAALEIQKESLGEIVSSEYLQSLNYMLQATSVLEDIKRIIKETSDIDDEISVDEKDFLLKTMNNTLKVIDENKKYYVEKTKRAAIASFVQNSNLMTGFSAEKYEMEAKNQGKKGTEKERYIEEQLMKNKETILIKEINYWTKQYEDGIADLRFLEYLIADPGMSKSQHVQLTKNMLDKSDLTVRNKMMDLVPDIGNWYEKLSLSKKGSPRKIFDKFLEKDKNNSNALTGAVIPEFTSKLREVFLKYEYLIKAEYKVLKKAKTSEEKALSQERIELLRQERNEAIKKLKKNDEFEEPYVNPEFAKLSKEEQDDLRFIHRNLTEADDRLDGAPEKKLTKTLADGTIIYNLPRRREETVEALKTGNKTKEFRSKVQDMLRPPSDEDELNVEEYDADNDEFGSSNLDIYGNEVYTIPVYYRNQLEDESLQSYDIPTLLVENHETTIFFEEHKLIEADLFTVAESLSSKNNDKIFKTDSLISRKITDKVGKNFQKSDQNLVYQAVKSSIDNRMYKRAYRGVYSKGNYRLIKAAELVSSYSSTLALAGSFMSGLTTMGQGSIYRLMEANVGEFFTIEDWKKGTAKTMKDFPNLVRDTQKFVADSKTSLLIKKFGLETQAKHLANKFVQDNFASKQLDSGTLFAVTSIAEEMVTSNLMYSLLSNIKVANDKGEYINTEGKIVNKSKAMSLDDAYTVIDGKLVLNKFVKYTSHNITSVYNDGLNKDSTVAATEVSGHIRGIYANMYGQYNQDMKSVFQRTIAGKLTMSLRGWLPRGVHRRWRGITDVLSSDYMTFEELRDEKNIDKRFYSQDQRAFHEGHYVTTIRYLKTLYKAVKANDLGLKMNAQGVKTAMTDHELANLKRTQYELITAILLFSLGMLLRALARAGGDDDDKANQVLHMTAYLSYRVSKEISTFINPGSFIDMIKNPAASMSTVERIFGWLNQMVGFGFDENGIDFNIDDVYLSGSKKDENKALMKTYGLIPGSVKFEQLKSILGLQSKNSIEDSFEYSLNAK